MTAVGPEGRAPRASLGPDARLGWVAFWFLGLSILEAGQLGVRLLVGLIPTHLHDRDPPFWPSVTAYAAGAAVYFGIWRGLRRGRGVARAAALVTIVAALLGTYLSLNTEAARPSPDSLPALGALSQSWRGVGWPGILTHLPEFVSAPSGGWRTPAFVAAGFALLVGLEAIWFLATGGMQVPSVRRASAPIGERVAGFSLAIHLSLHAILTVAVMIGLSLRIAGRL